MSKEAIQKLMARLVTNSGDRATIIQGNLPPFAHNLDLDKEDKGALTQAARAARGVGNQYGILGDRVASDVFATFSRLVNLYITDRYKDD